MGNFLKKCLTKDSLYGKMSARPWTALRRNFPKVNHMANFCLQKWPSLDLAFFPQLSLIWPNICLKIGQKFSARRAWMGPGNADHKSKNNNRKVRRGRDDLFPAIVDLHLTLIKKYNIIIKKRYAGMPFENFHLS